VLVSNFFLVFSFMVILISCFTLLVLFLFDLFSSDTATQGNSDYSYNFSEHQNYWEADK
jgi:hypothetical protein